MKQLGFVPNPKIAHLEPDDFTVPIPDERLELLDADLLRVFPIGQSASTGTKQPLDTSIPAVREGHSMVLDQDRIAKAYSANTVLSVPYTSKHVTPRLPDTLGER